MERDNGNSVLKSQTYYSNSPSPKEPYKRNSLKLKLEDLRSDLQKNFPINPNVYLDVTASDSCIVFPSPPYPGYCPSSLDSLISSCSVHWAYSEKPRFLSLCYPSLCCGYDQEVNLERPFCGLTPVLPIALEMERTTTQLVGLPRGRWPEKGTCEEGSEGGQLCLRFSILHSPVLLDPW